MPDMQNVYEQAILLGKVEDQNVYEQAILALAKVEDHFDGADHDLILDVTAMLYLKNKAVREAEDDPRDDGPYSSVADAYMRRSDVEDMGLVWPDGPPDSAK